MLSRPLAARRGDRAALPAKIKRCSETTPFEDGPAAPSLQEMLAERIAHHAARIVEETVRAAFTVTEFDGDEVLGPMGLQGDRGILRPPLQSLAGDRAGPSAPRGDAG